MWFGKIRKDIVIVFVIVIVIVTISRFRCDLDQERYCRTNYYFYSQSHGEYRMSWAQHLEKHEVVEIQFCKKELSRLRPDFLFSPPHWLLTWKLTMATWGRCWRKSKKYSFLSFLQIHGINGMIDQYYVESLPHLLQELDDVYHDVSAVVLESLTEGSNKITEKVGRL